MKEKTLQLITEINRIIWDYYGQLYINQFDNLEEMVK